MDSSEPVTPEDLLSSQNIYFSLEECAHCKEVGAELCVAGQEGRFFCHEDCARSVLGLPTVAKQIGTKLFNDPNLLVGYDLNTGQGGKCAYCLKKPIEYSTTLIGVSIGVCCKVCAKELATEMRVNSITSPILVSGWLSRRFKHKTYRQREILASAAWIWLRSRSETGPVTIPDDGSFNKSLDADARRASAEQLSNTYREAMMDVFHVMPDVAAGSGKDALYFDARFYDSFTAWCRCAADSAYAGRNLSYGTTPNVSYQTFTSEPLRAGAVPFMENLADAFDGRKVAGVLYRMFALYWRRYIRLHRQGGNAAIEQQSMSEPELKQRQDGNCGSAERSRNQHTVHGDISKVFFKLVNKYVLPDLEAHHVLKYGLFRPLTPELDELRAQLPDSRQQYAYDSPKLTLISSDLDVRAMGDALDALKRRFRSGRETFDFGKKYSASTLSRLILELALLNICVPDEANALKLDYASIHNVVTVGVAYNGSDQLRQLGFLTPEDNVKHFNEKITSELRGKWSRKVGKLKAREIKTTDQWARICRSSGGKIPVGRLRNLAFDIQREILGMLVYYWNDKKPPARGQMYTAHQGLVFRDIGGIYDDLHSKLGSEKTFHVIGGFFVTPIGKGATSTVTPGMPDDDTPAKPPPRTTSSPPIG